MPNTGAKKLAKEGSRKDYTQFCIEGIYVDEVLRDLPKDVSIIGAKVVVGSGFSKVKIHTPTKLKKIGVQSLRQSRPDYEATLVFDETTPAKIRKTVKAVAEELNMNVNSAYFKYLTLTNGDGSGRFQRTTKEIHPDSSDLRKKLVVLGLTDGQGKVQGLIRDISAKKYHCTIETAQVRTIVCSSLN